MISPTQEDEIKTARNGLAQLYRNNPIVLGDFDRLIQHLRAEFQMTRGSFNLPMLLATIDFAALRHVKQVRNHADWVPYIVHPFRVAILLWEDGEVRDEDTIMAALLHDILEDTQTVPEELGSLFGKKVLFIVEQLTESLEISLLDQAKAMSTEAKLVKLADRTHNLRDLLDHPPKVWKPDKVEKFIQKSRDLLEVLKEAHPALEKAYLDAIDSLEKANKI
ncbi:MAG: bifunctional (p)ppGpp synthetase/guanosine-3',5'-bis(diphosphate) 3'-pyrophosphohydrolase [Verrucomicrobia bacterium]|nr:bifunctional (p)ppGpp synthetase/guanosine-3',5'-bis(diphosphate) 3'-pyrophosphohydrolase [Verrucomicrobiota bacterium]